MPSRYTASHDTLSHVIALVEQARPEWDPGLVRIVLHSHTGHVDGNDLAIAALRAAADLNLPGPKSIGWRGPHWDGLGTKPPEIKDQLRCVVCGKTEPRCYSERPGLDDDHVFEPTERPVRVGR